MAHGIVSSRDLNVMGSKVRNVNAKFLIFVALTCKCHLLLVNTFKGFSKLFALACVGLVARIKYRDIKTGVWESDCSAFVFRATISNSFLAKALRVYKICIFILFNYFTCYNFDTINASNTCIRQDKGTANDIPSNSIVC